LIDRLEENQHTPWLIAAMIAPVTQAASNCSWPVAGAVSLLCLGIYRGMALFGAGGTPGRWIGAVQWLWMLLVISEFLHWSMLCWPNYGSYHAVPLVLLLLAAWACGGRGNRAARAGGLLRWFLILLFGAVLLSGLREVKPQNLFPSWDIQTAHLITVMLIPVMGIGLGKTKRKVTLLMYAAVVSVVTAGIMSMDLISTMEAPFYEMSKSLTLLGVGKRFESLVAAGMTLGYYVLTSYLISITANAWDMGNRPNRSVWITALFTALIFCSGMRMNSRLLALGTIGVWVALPMLKKLAKNEK